MAAFVLGLLAACSGLACSSTDLSEYGSGGGRGGGAAGSPLNGAGATGEAALPDGGGSNASSGGPAPAASPAVDYVSGVDVLTLAGSGQPGTQDGMGAAAQFDNPAGIAIDKAGDLLVVDHDSARVRRVTPSGIVMTLAAGYGFVGPLSVTVANDGTYYVGTDAATNGATSRTSGTVWRVPAPVGSGPMMPAVVAQGFGCPRGLAPIASGGGLLVADRNMDVVDQVTASGAVTVLGVSAQFDGPAGVAAMPGGAGWLVADANDNRIRLVTPAGAVTTFAGAGGAGMNDGPKSAALFDAPRAIAVDGAGNAYVSDAGNHRIRRIRVDGNVDTLAGDGVRGYRDGYGTNAQFYGQEGIAVSADGRAVYVADGNDGDGSGHHRVRVISVPARGGI